MKATEMPFLNLLRGTRQYIVPIWQRQYLWEKENIERLIDDLMAVGKAESDAVRHYGGAIITRIESGLAGGGLTTHMVVDGQQRLTTVSILLACIANKLGKKYQDTIYKYQNKIYDELLVNPEIGIYKLKLQSKDDEEYKRVLGEKNLKFLLGNEMVTQARNRVIWLLKKGKVEAEILLKGLNRFWIVSILLGDKDDAQQTFESLNTTGVPLSESEKVKNWLLLQFSANKHQEIYNNYWREIENNLSDEMDNAKSEGEKINDFLADFLSWKTGKAISSKKVYQELRRMHLSDTNPEKLLKDLVYLSKLYGFLTGASGEYPNSKIEKELCHLRRMSLTSDRPLTLRLLSDCGDDNKIEVAKTLNLIGRWITRLYLAGKHKGSVRKLAAKLASKDFPDFDSVKRYLDDKSKNLPTDEEVTKGIRDQEWTNDLALPVLYAIERAIAKDGQYADLTIEHVMPKELTPEWENDLGENAEQIHKQYCNRLANLTLLTQGNNSSLGNAPFHKKRKSYQASPIQLTRDISKHIIWNEKALKRRAKMLAEKALEIWPWSDV